MSLAVLPLAITMNAGPQIMSALNFVTAKKPLKLSAYFMAGVVIAVSVGVTITYTLASMNRAIGWRSRFHLCAKNTKERHREMNSTQR
jgi:small neutral amino acid transporter SnatA (MarC family)